MPAYCWHSPLVANWKSFQMLLWPSTTLDNKDNKDREVWFSVIDLAWLSYLQPSWFMSNWFCQIQIASVDPRCQKALLAALCRWMSWPCAKCHYWLHEGRRHSLNSSQEKGPKMSQAWHGTDLAQQFLLMFHHVPSCPIISHHFDIIVAWNILKSVFRAPEDHCLAVFIRCLTPSRRKNEFSCQFVLTKSTY